MVYVPFLCGLCEKPSCNFNFHKNHKGKAHRFPEKLNAAAVGKIPSRFLPTDRSLFCLAPLSGNLFLRKFFT